MKVFASFPGNKMKCLLCSKKVTNSPYSVCYDPDWKINKWGGDSHKYVGYLCVNCGRKIKLEKK